MSGELGRILGREDLGGSSRRSMWDVPGALAGRDLSRALLSGNI